MSISEGVIQSSFAAFFLALFCGAILAHPILRGLIALKARQSIYNLAPESHQKKQGTPTMGGIIILAGALVAIVVVSREWLLALWLVGVAAIGFADDYLIPKFVKGKRGLGWRQKIVAQMWLGIAAIPALHLPWDVWTDLLVVFLVLFFANAFNFADGLDALAGSLGILLCFGFAALAVWGGRAGFVPIMAALAGGIVPFLLLNAPPAKVFMGDVGSLPIGALFGAAAAEVLLPSQALSLQSLAPGRWVDSFGEWAGQMSNNWLILPVFVLSLVMIAELLPVPLQVGYFKLTKKRLFPMTPIHHSFEVKGWPETRVVWTFFIAQLVFVVFAVGLASIQGRGLTPMRNIHGSLTEAVR